MTTKWLRPAIALLFLIVIIPHSIAYSTPYHQRYSKHIRVLVVCTDSGDVMFANSLGLYSNVTVDVLYLGKDLPDDRSKLSDIIYLSKYDEIWFPDFNTELAYGGRLNRRELSTLKEYVDSGGVLVIGMNTYIQSWSRTFEEITGTRPIRVESSSNSSPLTILYNGSAYNYDSQYGVLVVVPFKASVLAEYSSGLPAVTVNTFGDGAGVVLTFNPVWATLEGDYEIGKLCAEVLMTSIKYRRNPPHVSLAETIEFTIERIITNQVAMLVIISAVLELLAYFGVLPFGVTMVMTIPLLPLSGFLMRTGVFREILQTVNRTTGITISELARELKISPRKLKYPLALMVLRGFLVRIDLSTVGGDRGDYLIVPKDKTSIGVAKWALRKYPDIMRRIIEEPGVSVIHLALLTDIPPYDLLRVLRELSRYGVVEVRKVLSDYEVYPLGPLREGVS